MVSIPCSDSDVMEISFGFYCSNAKGRIVLFGLFISRFMVVLIVVLFLPQNILFDLSSNMNFIAFLAGVSLPSVTVWGYVQVSQLDFDL